MRMTFLSSHFEDMPTTNDSLQKLKRETVRTLSYLRFLGLTTFTSRTHVVAECHVALTIMGR